MLGFPPREVVVVYKYGGTVPKSGKATFEFGGIKLCHRSLKKDKCDCLVHVETKALLKVFWLGTERSTILDFLADNLDTVENFIAHPELFEITDRPITPKKEKIVPEVHYMPPKEPSYSRSGSFAHLNKDYVEKSRKKYDLKDAKW